MGPNDAGTLHENAKRNPLPAMMLLQVLMLMTVCFRGRVAD